MLTLLALLAALLGPGPNLAETTGGGPARVPVVAPDTTGGGPAITGATSHDVTGGGPDIVVTLADTTGGGPAITHN
jgi:hypothetical protein